MRGKKTQSVGPQDLSVGTRMIDIGKLHLDRKNPRLVDYEIGPKPAEYDLATFMWQAMDCEEIALSIYANGYFKEEPLFAVNEQGKLIIVEGNRRLTAVRALIDDELRKRIGLSTYRLSKKKKEDIKSLPVVVANSRRAIWPYVGTRHVNGPRKWDSFSKAKYIVQVHREFNVLIPEIAKTIGDKHDFAQRIHNAYLILEQAESQGIFNRKDRKKKRFDFSHLYSALDSEQVKSFLGLRKGLYSKNPVRGLKNKKNLADLLVWLYGSRSEDRDPLVRTQAPDLRYLIKIIGSKRKDALASLRGGQTLEVALRIEQGEEGVLREALINAKVSLQKAKGAVTEGFKGERGLLELAESVEGLAVSLVEEMGRQIESVKRRRRI